MLITQSDSHCNPSINAKWLKIEQEIASNPTEYDINICNSNYTFSNEKSVKVQNTWQIMCSHPSSSLSHFFTSDKPLISQQWHHQSMSPLFISIYSNIYTASSIEKGWKLFKLCSCYAGCIFMNFADIKWPKIEFKVASDPSTKNVILQHKTVCWWLETWCVKFNFEFLFFSILFLSHQSRSKILQKN